MGSLSALQREFAAALVDPRAPVPPSISAAPAPDGWGSGVRPTSAGPAVAARFAVYRDNLRANYRAALADVYPVIGRLVGAEFLAFACDRFVRDHPSTSGDLHDFGAGFGGFLASFEPAAGLPYLPDVARLEWAWHEVFHEADPPAPDFGPLASLPPDRQGEVRVLVSPAMRLVESRFPILRIWEANQPGNDGDAGVDLEAGGERVLVLRRRDDSVELRPLAPAAFAFLAACAAPRTLREALSCALAADPAADPGALLGELVACGALVGAALAAPTHRPADATAP